MKTRLAAVLILATLVGLIFFWFRRGDEVLNERPEQKMPPPVSLPTSHSVALMQVAISYNAISEALDDIKELQSFSKSAREKLTLKKHMSANVPAPTLKHPLRMVRKDWDVTVSQDTAYTINVARTGGFAFTPNGNGLRLSVPIGFSGQVGFTGDIAKILSLNKKDFSGQIDLNVDILVDVDPNWTPIVTVKPSFDWKDKAQIEIVGGIWIPIAKYPNNPLQKALNRGADQIRQRIANVDLKTKISKLWTAKAFPLTERGRTFGYCNDDPKMHFSLAFRFNRAS